MLNSYMMTCKTEGVRVVTDYSDTVPTKCPHDSSHEIDGSQTVIYKTQGTQAITVMDAVDGFYQISSKKISIPSGQVGQTTEVDVSWPCPITMWGLLVYFDPASDGDLLDIINGPNTPIGYATQPISIGDTVLHVSPTVIAYIRRGLDVSVSNGVGISDCERVTNVDHINGTIQVEIPVSINVPIGGPILLNIHVIKTFNIEQCMISPNGISFGNRSLIGKNIPANMIMRIKYTNNSTTAKKIVCKMEYSITN